MRQLQTKDLFRMSRILKKMQLSLDTQGKTQEQLGAELLLAVMENLHQAQDEVNSFLGDLVGVTAEEFNELPVTESAKVIQSFFSLPGVGDFFKQAGQLTS